jgi:hypothetical protein
MSRPLKQGEGIMCLTTQWPIFFQYHNQFADNENITRGDQKKYFQTID